MSSMRNTIQRHPHRERAQPLERRRLGLLEKHKDYSLRAKDFNKKKEQLRALRQKAADRNEDEFYFGMMSRAGPGSHATHGRGWKGTVEGDRGNKAMDVDTVRLLKTQDMGYIRTMRQVAAKEVARLEQQVVLTRGLNRLDEDEDGEAVDDEDDDDMFDLPAKPRPARKIVFMDNEQDREEALDQIEDGDNDVAELEASPGEDKEEEEAEQAESLRRLRRRLDTARRKLQALTDAERELEVQQAKLAKTATSGGVAKNGKKIKARSRKR